MGIIDLGSHIISAVTAVAAGISSVTGRVGTSGGWRCRRRVPWAGEPSMRVARAQGFTA